MREAWREAVVEGLGGKIRGMLEHMCMPHMMRFIYLGNVIMIG